MTPFGAKVRAYRAERKLTLKAMAADLQLSPAYLSSLEHGYRGRPSEALVVQICEYFNLIWDDYEEMHRSSPTHWPRRSATCRYRTPSRFWRGYAAICTRLLALNSRHARAGGHP